MSKKKRQPILITPEADEYTFFTFPVLRTIGTTGFIYSIKFQNTILRLPKKPKRMELTLSAKKILALLLG